MEQQIRECEAIPEKKRDLISLLDSLESENANKATIEFRMNNYLDYKAREKGVPIRGTFELTPLCNLNCKMCYVHLSEQQLHETGKSILSGKKWIDYMRQAIEGGMIHALLTGGEVLSHPDFDEIYLYLINHGIAVAVNTNGLLLTEERIEFFRKYKPSIIQVSVYGYDDDTYEMVTGKRVFSHVEAAIKRLKESGIPTALGITPSRYLGDKAKKLLQFVSSLGIRFSVNAGLFDPRSETGRHNEVHDYTLEEYIDLIKQQAKLAGFTLKPACQDDIPRPNKESEAETRGLRCGGGRSSFAISWDGMLQPCIMLSEIRVDLVKTSFLEAWKAVNAAACQYPSPAECENCVFRTVCPVCVVQHAKGAPLGHANPLFCQRARMLALEGIVHPE